MGALVEEKNMNKEEHDVLQAIDRSQAVIEFNVDGIILSANKNFLNTMGYDIEDIKGKHHSMFCDPDYAANLEYRQFWEKLRRGEFQTGEFCRVGKDGKEVWIMATYNPILGEDGKPYKVIKFAVDISAMKAEIKVRSDIMNMTSIVSESDLKGNILNVNDKFIQVSKYSKEELIGKPHNTTRHPDMSKDVFKQLWATIGRGDIFRGIVKNRAKDGSPYYVDAVIAPIMGSNGKPKKYLGVRYDITETEIERQSMKGILKAIDDAFAYIEFDLNANVITANQNFLDVMGCTLDEIKGKHHRQFCDQTYANSSEYATFWNNLKAGNSSNGIFKRFAKSGKEVRLNAVYSPIKDEMGRVVKFVKLAQNMSDLIMIQDTATSLASASTELTATAGQLASTAKRTSDESRTAAALANDVAAGVQTVATNIEEMVASIKEIARSTNESSQMARTTLAKAQESNSTINKLGTSSQEIGAVIKVISSIAQQTNLLALNATIEAARAGEAGKGFAVVANEVKELAKQTAKATDDITNKIGAIQSDTKLAIDAISEISQAVDKLNGISTVIATAVEEQTATTNEISRVVVQSKRGVESIAEAITTVSTGASESLAGTSQTLDAAKELSQLSERLAQLANKTK